MKKYVGQMNVLGHKHTLTKVKEYEGGGSQTLPNGNHFGSWNFSKKITNGKTCPNWTFFISLESSWNADVESDFTFPIWKFKTQVIWTK